MELPFRQRGDELLPAGELVAIRGRLRRLAAKHDLVTVIACAFDHRTRMLPFLFADTRMVPAGVRAIGSAMVDSGFPRTRIVLQQWNKRFSPLQMELDGRRPDMFLVSSMGMHQDPARQMVAEAAQIDPERRPLIIVGGSLTVYQPYEVFRPAAPANADVAVTGEEYVLLQLLEVLLELRGEGESMRAAFLRARDTGALEGVPGLVYARGERDGVAEELVDTGIQRLVGDLDEVPDPVLGFGVLEPPSRGATLGRHAMPPSGLLRNSPIASLVLTFGCKFACPYCPIPAYNQRKYRVKSPGRIAEDMARLNETYGLRHFFGTDDNFFNDKARAMAVVETLAKAVVGGHPLRKKARWYTEVTVHDTLQMKDHLKLVHDAGCRALWLGVEDMTGTLVKKGQTVDRTMDAFKRLREVGICAMPMMMHHDKQRLWTPGKPDGLLNQVRLLRKGGAVTMQILMITPSPGSKLYDPMYESGQVLERVGGQKVLPYLHDGNHVIASRNARPWRQQLNLLVGYLYFYNPLWFLLALIRCRSRVGFKPAIMQVLGMLGVLQTMRRLAGYTVRMCFGKIERWSRPPASPVPWRGVAGARAAHDLVGAGKLATDEHG